jgi:polygalacturonase
MKIFLFSFLLLITVFASASPFNIKDFGATGNGKTLDTKAINNAIEAAAKSGGGTVYLPAGTYLSFSIHLASNISLYLDAGCVLLAADSASGGSNGYDEAEPGPANNYQDFGHSHWHNSLLWGENLHDVSILGPGIINGKGLTRNTPRRPGIGNKAVALKLCRNVILKDFTILNGGHFGILATGVDNLTINNLKMDTNRDGMDIDCCQNVRISDCTVNSPWDDAICLKSSMALGFARATENVTITNCQVSGYDLGSFYDGTYRRNEWNRVPDKEGPTGRIKFGTESNGGFKNITISNCVFSYCRGLALETVDGALLEDVTITNITMRDVVNAPLFLRLGSRMRGPSGTPVSALRRVIISNIVAYNADAHFASIIRGIQGHDIEDVQLNNINIYYRQIDSPATTIPKEIIEKDSIYPEPQKLGVMPAYGFVIRHATGIELNSVEVHFLGKETRPAFWIEDANDITLYRVKAQSNGSEKANLVKRNVTSLKLEQCQGIKQ